MKKKDMGFTLIELLAVIVIMGILMMIAIPAMSKIIENSRKDAFIDSAQKYANLVHEYWLSDTLYCGSNGVLPSTLGVGNYYVEINSSLEDLVERGGKSSWGNKDVYGYVKLEISVDEKNLKTQNVKVALADGVHGILELENGSVNDLKRKNVLLKIDPSSSKFKANGMTCVINGKGKDA